MKAPTNDHMRDWHFIVIKDKNTVVKLINKIPEQTSEEEINAILQDWNLNDTCQQNAYNAEEYTSALRIPLGDEGDWTRKVLNFPGDYLMPCFIAVGKASANVSWVEQKEYSITERIHKNVW